MSIRSSDNPPRRVASGDPPRLHTGKAFIATLIACCALVAFGMLNRVELSNEQVIAIAVLCVAAVMCALFGEQAVAISYRRAAERSRAKRLRKAEQAAARKHAQPDPGLPPISAAASAAMAASASGDNEPEPATSEPGPLRFAGMGRQPGGNSRKFGRLPLEQLTCNLGDVLDLSAGGMKVHSTEDRTGPVEITLQDSDGTLALEGVVVWSKRCDDKHWEQGVEFSKLKPEDRRRLTQFATNFRKRRTMCA